MVKLQPHQIEERAAEARNILNSEAFQAVIQAVQDRCIHTLLSEPVGSLTAASAHATMKALTEIKGELQSQINDEIILHKRGR